MKLKLDTKIQTERETPEMLQARLERYRSSAMGRHDSRPRRQRDRKSQKQAAIREW